MKRVAVNSVVVGGALGVLRNEFEKGFWRI